MVLEQIGRLHVLLIDRVMFAHQRERYLGVESARWRFIFCCALASSVTELRLR
jgi:hypothetical protein